MAIRKSQVSVSKQKQTIGEGKRGFVQRLVAINTPLRRSRIARVLKGSQFYLHTPRSSANGINHTCLCLPSRSWYSFSDPRRDGRLSWPWVAGWLHTEINVRYRELNPDTVAHLSTNRTRRRLTSSNTLLLKCYP